MCYNKSNRATYLRNHNSIAVEKLSFSSFLGFRGGAISEIGFSTEISPEVHSLWFACFTTVGRAFDANLLFRARFGP
jgi:hypothetical protein